MYKRREEQCTSCIVLTVNFIYNSPTHHLNQGTGGAIMKIFVALTLSLLVTVSIAATILKDEPSFCHDLDCPKYTLVDKKNGYEVRKYDASKWVGTTISSLNFTSAVNTGFNRLFKYISGENSAKTKIPMASPVATKIVPGQGPACESNFTVLFFTPFAFQTNTPQPTNPLLALVDLPAITAYVTSFGGWEDDRSLQEHSAELANQLIEDKADFVKDFYFTAGYDAPYRILERHNEVLWTKK